MNGPELDPPPSRDAKGVVLEYLRCLRVAEAAVVPQTAPAIDGVAALVTAVIRRQAPREHRLPDGTHYSVHGIGCLITLPDGAEVDVDIDANGPLLRFNAWRVWMFAESVGHDELTVPQLATALEDLASEGLLRRSEEGTGWYTNG
ncbi:DUF6896 domain-containing protein [Actinomadura rupiterrae]|uniref:DUF6896 domain-containing protein n=1 Tax=Actinomadura rupiterrae TaxID=559627 RepID=UPI0020A55E0D|nr:hypothetical protein [Actinomadura rupiterrae]MCP2337589.1 hypothetical protein [Actinomadura rupiterrae]